MRLSVHPWRDLLSTIALTCVLAASPTRAEVVCEGSYDRHLQGIAVDGAKAIYWSFTTQLVKTDETGKVLKRIEVPNHHGDLTLHDGRVYCAVNLGKFNQEPGKADSWVYVFDANDLALLAKHPTPEVVHGAGGMEYRQGRFYVIGGLPLGYPENYVYEYDEAFRFVKRHVVTSGYTLMGIQTTCFAHGSWWFGCYGKKLLQTDESFHLIGKYDLDFGTGIASQADKGLLRGVSFQENGRWYGKAVVAPLPAAQAEGR